MKLPKFPEIQKILIGSKGKNFFLLIPVVVINLLAAAFEGASFSCILFALEALGSSSYQTYEKIYFLNILPGFGKIASFSATKMFTFFLLGAIGLQILRSLFNFLSQLGFVYLGLKIQIRAEEKVYRQIFSLSFPCINRYKAGDLLEYGKISSRLIPSLVDTANRIFVSFFGAAGLITMMSVLSWKITLFTGCLFGFLGLIQKKILKKITSIARSYTGIFVNFTKSIVQNLSGLRTIHTFHQHTTILRRIRKSLIEIVLVTRKLQFWNHITVPINEISGIVLVGVFLVIGQYLIPGEKEKVLSILLTFVMMTYRLNTRLQNFLAGLAGVATQWGDILRLENILESKDKDFLPQRGLPFPGFSKKITFENVVLQYPGSKSSALQDLSVEFPKGKTTAIVGSSGSGKSSLIDLLLRLYEPTSGEILIDGKPLQDYEIGSYRKYLGVVSQDVFIFQSSIEENIRFGSVGASLDQIKEAAKKANAASFIERLPKGYSTPVGENGYSLSGGEKQRISLARALIRDPETLILDEATSNLDSESEMIIQDALEKLREDKTIIIVAHRLSTIQHADQILVLERGTVVEKGTHGELLRAEGRYAFFWDTQSKRAANSSVLEL